MGPHTVYYNMVDSQTARSARKASLQDSYAAYMNQSESTTNKNYYFSFC